MSKPLLGNGLVAITTTDTKATLSLQQKKCISTQQRNNVFYPIHAYINKQGQLSASLSDSGLVGQLVRSLLVFSFSAVAVGVF
jgi:hypothetical protein